MIFEVELDNKTELPAIELGQLTAEVAHLSSLRDVLAWAAQKSKDQVHPQTVTDVITQDEFTHDVIVPYKKVFLVFDTT